MPKQKQRADAKRVPTANKPKVKNPTNKPKVTLRKSLSADDWPKMYRKFVSWYVKPKSVKREAGQPTTIEEFCTTHQIDKSVVAQFWSHENFFDDIHTASFNWAKTKTPELLEILYEKIKSHSSSSDFRAWMDYVQSANNSKGQMSDSSQGQNNNFYFFNIDDDKKKQIAERFLNSGGE